jgi:hypothetical protein
MNPDRLPPGCFDSTVKVVDNRLSHSRFFKDHDTVQSLSAKWQLLPIEERTKIRKDMRKKEMRSDFKVRFSRFMEWLAGVTVAFIFSLLIIILSNC